MGYGEVSPSSRLLEDLALSTSLLGAGGGQELSILGPKRCAPAKADGRTFWWGRQDGQQWESQEGMVHSEARKMRSSAPGEADMETFRLPQR